MRPTIVSPSKLNIFLACPRQYHFEYIDQEMAKIKKQIKKKRPPMEMGSFVHDALTLFFKLPVEQRTFVKISALLKNLWAGPRGEGYGFATIEEEREYYGQALTMLKWFVESQNLNPKIFFLPGSPPGNSFDDYKKTPFGDGLALGGKIDRIDEAKDGTLEIIDYKTGKEKNDNLQLIAYTFLAEAIFKKPVGKTSYLFLKSKTRKIVIPEKSLRRQIKQHILQTVEKIADEKDWAPNISKLCAYCDYAPYCPAKEKIESALGIKIDPPPIKL